MKTGIVVEPLALHPWAIETLSMWFEAEWPAYYASGGQRALRDLQSYAQLDSLPAGVVALMDGKVCGVAALKRESIASHAHLSPWASAGLVDPAMRGQGIGALLLAGLENQARVLGFERIYCGTSTSTSLLLRCGWQLHEEIIHEGERLGVFVKPLSPP